MTDIILLPLAESERRLAAIPSEAVPIAHLGMFEIDDHIIPYVEIDASKHPDLANLARVAHEAGVEQARHHQEFEAFVTSKGKHLLALSLEAGRPAHCQMQLLFDLDVVAGWLSVVAATGMIVTLLGDVTALDDISDRVIAWEVCSGPIRQTLATWLIDRTSASVSGPWTDLPHSGRRPRGTTAKGQRRGAARRGGGRREPSLSGAGVAQKSGRTGVRR